MFAEHCTQMLTPEAYPSPHNPHVIYIRTQPSHIQNFSIYSRESVLDQNTQYMNIHIHGCKYMDTLNHVLLTHMYTHRYRPWFPHTSSQEMQG